jgi:hypothetical protein
MQEDAVSQNPLGFLHGLPSTTYIASGNLTMYCMHDTSMQTCLLCFPALCCSPDSVLLQAHANELPNVDPANYIAGGVVVFNLRTRAIKWSTHLDLSTDHTQYRAYIYSAPTVVDLDRDGKMEIVLGTSMVFLSPCLSGNSARCSWCASS